MNGPEPTERSPQAGRGEPLLTGPRNPAPPILSHARATHAHLDEAAAVAALLGELTDAVMVDVGANHGFAMAPFVERGWRIHAFEPEPGCRATLEDRFGAAKSVTIDARALGAEAREAVAFFTSAESSGIGTLQPFRDSHNETGRVDVTTLRAYAEANGLDRIDFLKVDTEGHDLFVLQGAPWDSARPRVILTEFEDAKTTPLGYDFATLASWLEAKGYVVFVSEWYPVRRYGVPHDWHALKRYPCELELEGAWGNLLAFDPEDAPALESLKDVLREHTKFRGRADRPDGERDPAGQLVSLFSEASDPVTLGEELATAAYYLSSVVIRELALVTRGGIAPQLPKQLEPELARAARELAPRVKLYRPCDAPRASLALRDDPRTARGAAILLDFVDRAQPGRAYLRRRNLRALSGLRGRLGRFDEARVCLGRAAPAAEGALRVVAFEDAPDDVGPALVVVTEPTAVIEHSAMGRAARSEIVRQATELGRTTVVPLSIYAHLIALHPEIENHLLGLEDAMRWRPCDPPDPAAPLGGLLMPLAALFADELTLYAAEDDPAARLSLEPLEVRATMFDAAPRELDVDALRARLGDGASSLVLDPEGRADERDGAVRLDAGWFEDGAPTTNRVARERLARELRTALEVTSPISAVLVASTIDALLPGLATATGLTLELDASEAELAADHDAITVALRYSRGMRAARGLSLTVRDEACADRIERAGGERPSVSAALPGGTQAAVEDPTPEQQERLALIADAVRLARLDGPARRIAEARFRSAEHALAGAAEQQDAVRRLAIRHRGLEREHDDVLRQRQRLQARISQLDVAVDARDARIAGLGAGIAARDQRVEQLEEGVADRDARVAQLDGAVAARDARIATLQTAVQQRDARIAKLEAMTRRWRSVASAPGKGARWVLRHLKKSDP